MIGLRVFLHIGNGETFDVTTTQDAGCWRDVEEECSEAAWALGDYDNGEPGCPNCGRRRLCKCDNGMRRCEKCNWCPELNDYAPVRSL